MAKKLSNKNQALLALGAVAAIGVFLYTRKKPATAGRGAVPTTGAAFKNLLSEVQEATEYNDHTGALILITDYFYMKDLSKLLRGIAKRHEKAGSVSFEDYYMRIGIEKDIRWRIESKYGWAIAEKIYYSL